MQRDLDERIQAVLRSSGFLRNLSKGLRGWLTKTFVESPLSAIKNLLNGTWLEHPLHPVVTDIPIGSWTTALVLDLASLVFSLPALGAASAIAIGVGLLGALAALVTGLLDYTDTGAPEDTIAITHGIVNLTATILFAISFFMRMGSGWQTNPSNFVVALLGYGAVTVGGFLGGSLLFRHGVMVNRNAFREAPKQFIDAVALDKLPDNKPTKVDVGELPVLFVKRGERIYAVGAVCSHYGAPMEQGTLEEDRIVCPWHHSVYELTDGSVKRGPTTSPLPAYETRVRNGRVEIRAAGLAK